MTVTILVMSLISVNLVLAIKAITTASLNLIEERVDVSLLFKSAADPKVIEEIRETLGNIPLVKSLNFSDRPTVLANFKEKHKDNQEIINALAELEDNPFGASLVIRAASSRDYEVILRALDAPEYEQAIEETTLDDHSAIIKRIGFITGRVQKIGLVISLLFVIVSFLIIFNTIKVGVYTHREEIGIMKLVGATNWFVRSPFFLEVMLNSLLAITIASGVFYFGLWFSEPYFDQFFLGTDFSLLGHFRQNWLWYLGGELLALIALNILSASLAMRRFLKV